MKTTYKGRRGAGPLRNNRGVALILVLVIATVALAVTATLLYIISVNSRMTGVEKRYESALDAAEGVDGVAADIIGQRLDITAPGHPYVLNAAAFTDIAFAKRPGLTPASGCWQAKMYNDTALWPLACDHDFNVSQSSYDFHYTTGGAPSFDVYAKIINTVSGNTAPDLGLRKNGVVASSPGDLAVPSRPYMYMIETVAINQSNTSEQARVSLLYQY